MDIKDGKFASGYSKPSWVFKGRQELPYIFLLCLYFSKDFSSISVVSIVKDLFCDISCYVDSALYQLHLVKAETERAFIPKDFKLVKALYIF